MKTMTAALIAALLASAIMPALVHAQGRVETGPPASPTPSDRVKAARDLLAGDPGGAAAAAQALIDEAADAAAVDDARLIVAASRRRTGTRAEALAAYEQAASAIVDSAKSANAHYTAAALARELRDPVKVESHARAVLAAEGPVMTIHRALMKRALVSALAGQARHAEATVAAMEGVIEFGRFPEAWRTVVPMYRAVNPALVSEADYRTWLDAALAVIPPAEATEALLAEIAAVRAAMGD